jgi:hypothetical protein
VLESDPIFLIPEINTLDFLFLVFTWVSMFSQGFDDVPEVNTRIVPQKDPALSLWLSLHAIAEHLLHCGDRRRARRLHAQQR